MKPWLAIPVKSLHEGKSRLAGVLSDLQRHRLNTMLLEHVLAQAAQFPGAEHTLIVTPCAQAAAVARRAGVEVLVEGGVKGMNAALDEARRHVVARQGAYLMTASCDLPLLRTKDLLALAGVSSAGSAERRIAIASDHTGHGTNALCVPTDVPFTFRFGSGSARLHREAAATCGLPLIEIERLGLALDLDTPVELQALRTAVPWLWPQPWAA
jgi:2-phospho-L-lactate guanylyltransferase